MTTKFLLSSDDNTRSGLLKKKIIHYYMANGDATIAEVCKEMNLSIPTVTKLISELQEDGYNCLFMACQMNNLRFVK